MANKIEEVSGIPNSNFVGQTSRYLNSKLINYQVGNTKFLTFKTFKRPTRVTSSEDRFYVITPGTEYRPDIVAKKVYGNEGYWWVLLLGNNIFDIYDFKAGKTIVIPSPYL